MRHKMSSFGHVFPVFIVNLDPILPLQLCQAHRHFEAALQVTQH